MKFRRTALSLIWGAALGLAGVGCGGPARAERRDKAEAAFDRLAQVPPERLAAGLNRRMTEVLQLSPEQQASVEAINLKYARQLHDLAASDESLLGKARGLREQVDAKAAELKGILTPEQFSRFEAMKEELREAIERAR